MLGLARLAWALAYRRAWGVAPETEFPFLPRMVNAGAAHGEYYAIIDRLTRGEKP